MIENGKNQSYKKKIFSSRVDSTKLLYNSIKKLMNSHKVKNIVSASAIGIYPSDDKEVQTETTATSQESFMQNVVLSWERELTAFESLKIKVAKLRLGLVLTKKGGVLGPLKIAAKFGLSSAFGTGKQGQSWIHIQDTVRMFIEAVEKNTNKIHESADVLYHLIVYLEANDIKMEDVMDELKKRRK